MKKNFFKLFLVFIIFFNFIFFSSIQESFATVGAKDRIRSIIYTKTINTSGGIYDKNENTINEAKSIHFTYNKEEGFSCTPGSVFYEKVDRDFLNSLDGVDWITLGEGFWDFLKNFVLIPLSCFLTFYGVMDTIRGEKPGIKGFLSFGAAAIIGIVSDKIDSLIDYTDDYNLDQNGTTACKALYWTQFSMCASILIIIKLYRALAKSRGKITNIIKISLMTSLFVLITTLGIVRETIAYIYYKKAKKFFNNLHLCGDNWLVYGSDEIIEKYKDSNNKIKIDIDELRTLEYFPDRSDYPGSYKYKLSRCFDKKDINICKSILKTKKNEIIDISNIDSYMNMEQKAYREYFYDGIEYENPNCNDPRPERKTYDIYALNGSLKQVYYFRGTEPANFACDRFLISSSKEFVDAYNCCLDMSQKTVCVEDISNRYKNYSMCNVQDGICSLKSSSVGDDVKINKKDIKEYCSKKSESIDSIKKNFDNKEINDADRDSISEVVKKIDDFNSEELNSDDICGKNDEDLDKLIDRMKKDLDDLKFRIIQSEKVNDSSKFYKYCVETFNFCPYNFKLLGGTEEFGKDFMITTESGFDVKCEEDIVDSSGNSIGKKCKRSDSLLTDRIYKKLVKNDEILNCTFDQDGYRTCYGVCNNANGEVKSCFNKPSNFCQIDRHCTFIKRIEPENTTLYSPYLSKACINNVGSSHNFQRYSSNFTNYNSRLFTAPFVECFVETFKNMLLNRAGHTRCINNNEIPYKDKNYDKYEKCDSGEVFVEGEKLDYAKYKSPFNKLQESLFEIVKIILAIAIVLYGYNILIKKEGFDYASILKFVITSTIVIYFSSTNRWTDYVFNFIYSVSSYVVEFSSSIMSNISFDDLKFNSIYDNYKYPGCYFFKHNEIINNFDDYGSGRTYLALFDTLDCKISRYFGYTTGNLLSNPPIVNLFLSGVFTLGFSILFILPFVIIFISIIFICIKISYQFILYSLELTVLLFISPLIIPLYLVPKTKKIFDSWINNILNLMFKPMFLIISSMLFLTIFDKYFIDEAKFYGKTEPIRNVYCGEICKISEGNFYYIVSSNKVDSDKARDMCIKNANGKVIDLSKSAPICSVLFNNKTYGSSTNLFDVIISGFSGFPTLIKGSFDVFYIFSTLMFLIIIILIFDKFISVSQGLIFGGKDGTNLKLLKFTSKVSHIFAKLFDLGQKTAKKPFVLGRHTYEKIVNKNKEKTLRNKLFRENYNGNSNLGKLDVPTENKDSKQ